MLLRTLTLFTAAVGLAPSYPETRTVQQTDVYHGVSVADPHRWLEDDWGAEVRAWTDAQNATTDAYLAQLPGADAWHSALRAAWNVPRQSAPWQRAGMLFNQRNTGDQAQDVVWVQQGDAARVLLDPNTLPQGPAGEPVSLANLATSRDGRFLAYAVSLAGSDWQTWHVRNTATGADLTDTVAQSKFDSAAWLPDASGFFYVHYPRPSDEAASHGSDAQPAIYLHRLGSDESADVQVFAHPDAQYSLGAEVSDDGGWLVISAQKGSGANQLWLQSLAETPGTAVHITRAFVGENQWLGNDARGWLLHTTAGAPRGRVVRVPLLNAAPAQEIIAQTDDTLVSVRWFGDVLICNYLHDAHSRLRVVDLQGKHLEDLALPGPGTASGFAGVQNARDTYYTFTNATTPPTVYHFEMATRRSTVWFSPVQSDRSGTIITEQVFFPSADGTRLSMFISRPKDLPLDGTHPTLLYGYGGFNIPVTPNYNPANHVWLQRGGIYASAVLRGGGEYGDAWHWAGTQEHKQNVFDDFIAAAHYLIDHGYTSPAHLAIEGASNGGLLVGACLTQQPALFGAALPQVGVLDMLRFERFTAGRYWTEDYGSVEDPKQFAALYAYSPLHRLRDRTAYPPTLIITGDHDDRVVPAHSFKFAAALQAAQGGDAPVLLRVLHNTGHGAGRSLAQRVALAGERLVFLENTIGPMVAQDTPESPR